MSCLLVSHGGPIATPDDARTSRSAATAVGFIGASSMGAPAGETAITDTVRAFKEIPASSDPEPAIVERRRAGWGTLPRAVVRDAAQEDDSRPGGVRHTPPVPPTPKESHVQHPAGAGVKEPEIIARGAPQAKPAVRRRRYAIKWLFAANLPRRRADRGTSSSSRREEPLPRTPLRELLYLISGELDHSWRTPCTG